MKKQLTPEQVATRKKTNVKILKYGCLPIFGILALIIILLLLFAPEKSESRKWLDRAAMFDTNIHEGKNIAFIEQNFDSVQQLLTEYTPEMEKDTSLVKWNTHLTQLLNSRKEYVKDKKKALAKDNLFSAWDGSNPTLVKIVKNGMNDPDSFEHVETLFWDTDENSFIVKMRFRGKNAFGAKIMNTVRAVINYDGSVSEVKMQ